MYQQICILGRLGGDPEMRYTGTGKAVTNISVATDRKWKDGEEWKTETTWFRVTCWNVLGENVSKFLKKGSLVFVTGTIHTNKYVNNEGTEVSSWEVIADTVKFLDPKKQEEIPF